MEDNKCKFILEGGERCGAYAIHNEDYCFNHHPDWQEKKHLAVVKGGSIKQIKVDEPLEVIAINSPKDIITLLTATIAEIRQGKIDPHIANTVGYLAGQLIKAFEIAELNDKAEQIKELISQMTQERIRERRYGR